MKYWLNENILITFGKIKSVIYNLNGEFVKIIWNSEEQTKEILEFLETKKESEYISALIDADLISINKVQQIQESSKIVNLQRFNFAWIEITNTCNYKCLHCYGSFSPNKLEEMNLDDIKLITKELKTLNINNVQVIGGEPFSLERNKLKEILTYLVGNFKVVEVYTNASFLDKDWLEFIKANNLKISISLYHHTNEIHNKITQNSSSFDTVKNSIKLLEEFDINYRVGYTKTKFNKSSSIKLLTNNLGIKKDSVIKIDAMRITGRGSKNLIDSEIIDEKSITLNTFTKLKIKSNNVKNNLNHHNCFSTKFYIDVELNILPCVMERRISYGNLKTTNLKNMLGNQGEVINLTKSDIESCNECEFRFGCFDCRPDTLSKNFKAKPYYCKYEPSKGKWND